MSGATSRFVAEPGAAFDQPLAVPRGSSWVRVFTSEPPRLAPLADALELVGFNGAHQADPRRFQRNQLDLPVAGLEGPFRLRARQALTHRVILSACFVP